MTEETIVIDIARDEWWEFGVTMPVIEMESILSCLRYYGGNRTHAAYALGISRRALISKLGIYAEHGALIPSPTRGVKLEKDS